LKGSARFRILSASEIDDPDPDGFCWRELLPAIGHHLLGLALAGDLTSRRASVRSR
jgi:hypothetical protein